MVTSIPRQRTAISEALAVACLDAGVTAMTADAMPLEAAFRRAWWDWDGRGDYRLIRAELPRNDIRQILFDSGRRRIPCIAVWSTDESMWVRPRLTVPWTTSEAVEHLDEIGDTSWQSWTALATAFLGYFKECELRRIE